VLHLNPVLFPEILVVISAAPTAEQGDSGADDQAEKQEAEKAPAAFTPRLPLLARLIPHVRCPAYLGHSTLLLISMPTTVGVARRGANREQSLA
jgi:hypothetical protein